MFFRPSALLVQNASSYYGAPTKSIQMNRPIVIPTKEAGSAYGVHYPYPLVHLDRLSSPSPLYQVPIQSIYPTNKQYARYVSRACSLEFLVVINSCAS